MLHSLTFRLSYSECDPAGIIYYGAYHPWMERTYTDWSFRNGLRTDELAADRGILVMSRASAVAYERSPRVYDELRCEMRLAEVGTTSFKLRHDFVAPDEGHLYAYGLMTMVTCGTDRRPVPLPEWLAEPLHQAGPPAGTTP